MPTKLFTLLDVGADAVSLFLPLALVAVVLAAPGRTLGVYHFAFGAVVTLVLLADPGTTYNHLLDLGVLSVVLVGMLWAEQAPVSRVLGLLVPVVAVWAAVGSYALAMHGEAREAAAIALGRSSASYPPPPLARRIAASDALFSEEPWVPVSLDRLPTVLDPYSLLRIADEHPDWEAELVGRLERGEFDWVVLRYDHVAADGAIDVSAPWWQNQNFGPTIVGAIARGYRFREAVQGYALYAPAVR